MDQAEVYSGLQDIFRDIFDDDEITLTAATSAADIPEWDSFNHVNIIVASEMRFGVKFRAAELDELKNVGDFVGLLQKKLNGGEVGPGSPA
jgi:acyl carrier protein